MGNEQQRDSNRYPGGYYTSIPNGPDSAPIPTARPVNSAPPPVQPSSAARPAQPSHAYHPSAPPAHYNNYNPSFQNYEDERAREDRATATAARLAKLKVKKRTSDQSKQESWKKYDELGKREEQNRQITAVGYRVADSMKVVGGSFYQNSAPSSGAAEQKNGGVMPDMSDDDLFELQIAALREKVRKMPLSSVQLLKKILGNVVKAPEPSPTTSPPAVAAARLKSAPSSSSASAAAGASAENDPMKFRRLKLSNEKIARDIVRVDGAMQLLRGVGFDETMWNGEKVLMFHLKTPTDLAQVALDELQEMVPDSAAQSASAPTTPAPATTTLKPAAKR